MIYTIFDRISDNGLTSWAVLLQGISGIPEYSDNLPSSYVANFANIELEKITGNDPLLDVIVDLADNVNQTVSELLPQLQKICEIQNADMQQARRIWRAFSLEEILGNLDCDPLYGLIKISEFWSSWGWPIDAPQSMIPGANNLQEHDYHSALNFQNVIQEHIQWLKDEMAVLK